VWRRDAQLAAIERDRAKPSRRPSSRRSSPSRGRFSVSGRTAREQPTGPLAAGRRSSEVLVAASGAPGLRDLGAQLAPVGTDVLPLSTRETSPKPSPSGHGSGTGISLMPWPLSWSTALNTASWSAAESEAAAARWLQPTSFLYAPRIDLGMRPRMAILWPCCRAHSRISAPFTRARHTGRARPPTAATASSTAGQRGHLRPGVGPPGAVRILLSGSRSGPCAVTAEIAPGNPGASVDERAVDVEEGMSKAAATVGRFLVAPVALLGWLGLLAGVEQWMIIYLSTSTTADQLVDELAT